MLSIFCFSITLGTGRFFSFDFMCWDAAVLANRSLAKATSSQVVVIKT